MVFAQSPVPPLPRVDAPAPLDPYEEASLKLQERQAEAMERVALVTTVAAVLTGIGLVVAGIVVAVKDDPGAPN